MEGDEVGRVKHQHAHAITGTNARLAQACGELADARRQRAIAQRFLGAQDRGLPTEDGRERLRGANLINLPMSID